MRIYSCRIKDVVLLDYSKRGKQTLCKDCFVAQNANHFL